MKKIFTLAMASLLFVGSTFADEGKNCGKGKSCCKKECSKKSVAGKEVKSAASVKKA